MDKARKLGLIQRTLGLRHKIKVHESMKAPDTHEELAQLLLAKWDLEDELRAIEKLLAETRDENVEAKKMKIEKESQIPRSGRTPQRALRKSISESSKSN